MHDLSWDVLRHWRNSLEYLSGYHAVCCSTVSICSQIHLLGPPSLVCAFLLNPYPVDKLYQQESWIADVINLPISIELSVPRFKHRS